MENSTKPHPLLIDHVVENIFSISIFTNWDFLVLREICLIWNVAASKQCTIELSKTEESVISRMENLIVFLQNPKSSFSSVNKLDFNADFFLEYENEEFHTTFGSLLGLVASQLVFLRVEVHESSELVFQADCYKIGSFNRLQTLESEVIRNPFHPKRSDFTFVPHLIGNILERASSLKTLLMAWVSNSQLNWPHLGDVLYRIPKSLQRLVIQRVRFGANDFEVFSSLQLPNLRSLFLLTEPSYCTFSVTSDHVYNLFANSKNETLLELDLTIRPILRRMPGFKLPVFPNVHTLKLGEVSGFGDFEPGVDMSLLTIFPKVTQLDLTGLRKSDLLLTTLLPTGLSVPQVKSCCICMDKYSYFDAFTELTKLVVKVSISVSQLAFLGRAFRHRAGIENLELELEEAYLKERPVLLNLDSILTGIPAEMRESIKTNPDWREIPIETIKVQPGISDLRNLQTLSIKSQIPANITDVTAQFAFLQLPKLKDLVIEEFNMSESCIQNLKLKFGERVIRHSKNRRCNDFYLFI